VAISLAYLSGEEVLVYVYKRSLHALEAPRARGGSQHPVVTSHLVPEVKCFIISVYAGILRQ
jgi:hypothetical protein